MAIAGQSRTLTPCPVLFQKSGRGRQGDGRPLGGPNPGFLGTATLPGKSLPRGMRRVKQQDSVFLFWVLHFSFLVTFHSSLTIMSLDKQVLLITYWHQIKTFSPVH